MSWCLSDVTAVHSCDAAPDPMTPASNEQSKFTATAAVTSQPNLKATVA